MSDLVGNPEYRFSHNEAHFILHMLFLSRLNVDHFDLGRERARLLVTLFRVVAEEFPRLLGAWYGLSHWIVTLPMPSIYFSFYFSRIKNTKIDFYSHIGRT